MPLDPAGLAPALDRTVASLQSDATQFLYTGANPVQSGVAAGTIVGQRAATARGKVFERLANGTLKQLQGVTVTVKDHAELGSTKSRLDGAYDLVVNGGGPLTFDFAKAGFFPAQRTANVPWQDYHVIDDVILMKPDSVATTVAFGASAPAAVAAGSQTTDADGPRQAALLVPAGTVATVTAQGGTPTTVSSLTLRLTEYTVGQSGREMMPAPLPPTSAYTYAVEMSADGLASGTQVTFSQPVPFYVDNFLGFPVGTIVPVGAYDRATTTWVPEDNGRVVRVISTSGGVATVDVNGDGVADTGAPLDSLGIDAAELAQVATRYATGTTFMRTETRRLMTGDLNFPAKLLGVAPRPPIVSQGCAARRRDVIRCDVQQASHALPLAGTPFSLAYRSGRTAGGWDRSLTVQVIGDTVPDRLQMALVEVFVAGRTFRHQVVAQPNQQWTLEWDGLDAYGRQVQGNTKATVRVSYAFPLVFQLPAYVTKSFASVCEGKPNGNGSFTCELSASYSDTSARASGYRVAESVTTLGGWDAKAEGLGGFTLDAQHRYDPVGQVLYRGDGSNVIANAMTAVASRVAGSSDVACDNNIADTGDGALATAAVLQCAQGLAVGPDGSIYVSARYRVRRIAPNGIITTVAGNGQHSWSGFGSIPGEGGTATSAQIGEAGPLTFGPDGLLYIADQAYNRILRLTSDGLLVRALGSASSSTEAQEGLAASQLKLLSVLDLKFGPDAALYFTQNGRSQVWRVGRDSIIRLVAGTATSAFSGNGGPARRGSLQGQPAGLAFGPDGSLFIATGTRVYRVGADGILMHFAGNGTSNFITAGSQATQSPIETTSPAFISVGNDGTVYFGGGNQLHQVTTDGVINLVAGTWGVGAPAGDRGPALRARFGSIRGVLVSPDGAIYLAERQNSRVRKFGQPMPGYTASGYVVPSGDGTEIYEFDARGRHLTTRHAITGDTLFLFGYDGGSRVVSITDRDGRVTTIQRDANRKPTGVLAPTGQLSSVQLDANGNLAALVGPGGVRDSLLTDANGLLREVIAPSGAKTQAFAYDASGRLVGGANALGGTAVMSATPTGLGSQVVITEPHGRVTSLTYAYVPDQRQVTQIVTPEGLVVRDTASGDSTRTILPDGTVITRKLTPSPRFGMQSATGEFSVIVPGSPTLTRTMRVRTGLTLVDPADPFSFATQVDSIVVNGQVTTLTTDRLDYTTTVLTPGGRTVQMEYDRDGRLLSTAMPGRAAETREYDTSGRLSAVQVGGRWKLFGYDGLDRITSIRDPLGRRDSLVYNAKDQVTRRILPDGREIAFGYDTDGKISSITPPSRPAHLLGMNVAGLLTGWTPPQLLSTEQPLQMAYDSLGRLKTTTRQDGSVIAIAYRQNGLQEVVTLPGGSDSLVITRSATTGNYASATRTGAVGLAYTFQGSLPSSVTYSGAVNGSVARTYDNFLRPLTQSVSGNNTVQFGYDADWYLTQAGALSLTRHPQTGHVQTTTLGSVTTRESRTAQGELDTLRTMFNGSVLYEAVLIHDSLGRIRTRTETVSGVTTTRTFQYDTAARLWRVEEGGVMVEEYAYDQNGNRTQRTTPAGVMAGSADARDRLQSWGAASYVYLPTGELRYRITGTDTTMYIYDALGNLRAVQQPSGSLIEYVVDARNRRVGRRVNGALERGWLYDGQLTPVAELNAAGAIVTRFVYGERPNVPEYMVRAGVTYRFVHDERGSVRLVVNSSTGAIVQQLDYDAFGRVALNTNPDFQPFGYSGGLYDTNTRLVHFGARDYDAETGRWTSSDPIGFGGGSSNLYAYVNADPVNHVDPSGLSPTVGELAAATAVGGILGGIEAAATSTAQNRGKAIARGILMGSVAGLASSLAAPGIAASAAAEQLIGSSIMREAVAYGLANSLGNVFGQVAGFALCQEQEVCLDPLGMATSGIGGAAVGMAVGRQAVLAGPSAISFVSDLIDQGESTVSDLLVTSAARSQAMSGLIDLALRYFRPHADPP